MIEGGDTMDTKGTHSSSLSASFDGAAKMNAFFTAHARDGKPFRPKPLQRATCICPTHRYDFAEQCGRNRLHPSESAKWATGFEPRNSKIRKALLQVVVATTRFRQAG
jgi:hypothetical protein